MNKQYVCPNCFYQLDVNDVLFERTVISRKQNINRLRLWKLLHRGGEAGRSYEDYGTADWKLYPEDQRIVENGVIVGIRDYNGDLLTRKLCPVCNFSLLDQYKPKITVLPWSEHGIEYDLCSRFFNLLDETDSEKDGLALEYLTHCGTGGAKFLFPVGLKFTDEKRSEYTKRMYELKANAGIIWCDLEESDEKDYPIVEAIQNYLNVSGAEDCIERPTVVFVIGADNVCDSDSIASWMYEKHYSVINAIHAGLSCHKLLLWNEEKVTVAADWLEQCSLEDESGHNDTMQTSSTNSVSAYAEGDKISDD